MQIRRLFTLLIALSFSSVFAQQPQIVVQSGHSGMITGVTVSPNGKYVASISGSDHKTVIWDVKTGKEFRAIHSGYQGMCNVAFGPNGKYIYGLSAQDSIRRWNIITGAVDMTFPPTTISAMSLDVSPDGKRLVLCGVGFAMYDLEAKKQLKSEMIPGLMQRVKFSADGKTFAMTGVVPEIQVWDTETLTKTSTVSGLPPITSGFRSFAYTDKHLVTSSNKEILFYDIKTGKKTTTVSVAGIYSFALSPDGKMLAVCTLGAGGTGIKMISADGKTTHWELKNRVGNLTFSPDGAFFVSGEMGMGGMQVYLRDIQTGEAFHQLKGYFFEFRALDIAHNHPLMVFGGLNANMTSPLKSWELSRGVLRDVDVKSHHLMNQVLFHGTEKEELFVARGDSSFSIHHPPMLKLDKRFRNHKHWVQCLAVSPDGKWVATGSFDKEIQIADKKTGKVIRKLEGQPYDVKNMAFHPTENVLVTTDHSTAIVWDAATGTEKKRLPVIGYGSIDFSDDGKMLVLGDNNGLHLYDYPGLTEKWSVDPNTLANTGQKDHMYPSVAFNAAGTLIAGGTYDGRLKIWTSEGKLKCEIHEHSNAINALDFAPGDEVLVTASSDASIKMWDVLNCKLIATLIVLDSVNFVAVTPDNYYMATKPGLEGVAFRVEDKIFPFEQFDLQYNRPDIVLKRLGFADVTMIDAYYAAYQKRLRKMNFEESAFTKEFHMPEIHVNTEGLTSVVDKAQYNLELKASDSKYNLDRINLYVNDVPVQGRAGYDLKSKSSKSIDMNIPVDLSAGMNKIQVSVLNEKGVESFKETVTLQYKGGKLKSDLYLVTIGVSDYADDRFDLTYASKDAKDLASLLQTAKGTFANVKVKSLLDAEVTSENIKGLRSFLEPAHIDDVVIVFIAGHGLLNENMDYFFGTTNINFDDPTAGGLSYEELEKLLEALKCRKKLLIMDTCHSGEVDKEEMETVKEEDTKVESGAIAFRAAGLGVRKKEGIGLANSYELMKFMFADLNKGIGATVISSAGGAEYAMESAEWNNGVFTYTLLNGLKSKKADGNHDGFVSISELRDYVKSEVSRLTSGKQVPTARSENLTNDFRVW